MLTPMLPTDSVFLTVESRETPMHVGGLQLFEAPADGPMHVRALYDRMLSVTEAAPLFSKRARRSLATVGQWGWEPDKDFDVRHHVRHSALPAPGRTLELLALCSRLHGSLLDRQRPLWELHLIEGLADGRFAIYFKVHHSLIDGVSAQRVLQSVLSTDPQRRDMLAPWAPRAEIAESASETSSESDAASESFVELTARTLRDACAVAADLAGVPGSVLRTIRQELRADSGGISLIAPKSILNVPITGSRRFAAQQWPLERVKNIARAADVTLNDVVLGLCSGALRRYLLDLDALPNDPLISMVPVALRTRDHDRQSGNAVGAVMCNLGTDLADPAKRMDVIRRSMVTGKKALAQMSPLQIVALTGLGMSPLLLASIPGLRNIIRPPFNLIISNVPGPRSSLYYNGARLDGLYPLSIPYHGQALNITCTSYAGQLAFGLTGCRRQTPHLQRLLTHLDDEFGALEVACGV